MKKMCVSRHGPDTQHVRLIECIQRRKRILGSVNRFKSKKNISNKMKLSLGENENEIKKKKK